MACRTFLIVTAHNEADRLRGTLNALSRAFPEAHMWVADDGSTDASAEIAEACGAQVVRSEKVGKGRIATLAARAALADPMTDGNSVALLCDGDLGDCAGLLTALVDAVAAGETDLAVARFARRVGGGVGLAIGFARLAIRRLCGFRAQAPISGQRALRASVLEQALPFAHGFGMEIGMTVDVVRRGYRVLEIDLDLSHRATGRTLAGFFHRGRQLVDFVRVYLARRARPDVRS
jgi:glycosyltransferase involved in cell wall biosynthesis